VLFGMVALGIGSAAAFYLVRTESRLAWNERDISRAFAVAQAGLERFVGENLGALPTAPVTYDLPGGRATVSWRKVLDLEFPNHLVVLTSVGEVADRRFAGPAARRVVRQYGIYRRAPLNVSGAIAAPHGIHKNGSAGVISGYDAASPSQCPEGGQDPVAGVVVPPGGYTQSGGGTQVPKGDPPVREEADSLAVARLVDVPWKELISGGVPMDYVIPPQGWPNFAALPPQFYPTILVNGNVTLGPAHTGRGTLIVTGNVTLNGAFQWQGVILVGKRLVSNGNNNVYGTVATGLNVLLGDEVVGVDSVYPTDLGNGTKVFQYHSCNVINAGKRLAYLRMLPNTWWEGF
jgi:hypothetical protein